MSTVPKHYETSKRSYKPAQTAEPGFTLNKLSPDDFHEICGLTETVRKIVPDSKERPWGTIPVGTMVKTPEGVGELTGYAVDTETDKVTEFARVNGRLYHVKVLKYA